MRVRLPFVYGNHAYMTSRMKESAMKIRLLSTALLAGLAVVAQSASAQEFDDRWYLTGSAGYNLQDDDRRTDDAYALGLGVGKFISPAWSLEGALNYQNPNSKH